MGGDGPAEGAHPKGFSKPRLGWICPVCPVDLSSLYWGHSVQLCAFAQTSGPIILDVPGTCPNRPRDLSNPNRSNLEIAKNQRDAENTLRNQLFGLGICQCCVVVIVSRTSSITAEISETVSNATLGDATLVF